MQVKVSKEIGSEQIPASQGLRVLFVYLLIVAFPLRLRWGVTPSRRATPA